MNIFVAIGIVPILSKRQVIHRMWIIDVAFGFALGYLYAFLKYKKKDLEFITKASADNQDGESPDNKSS